MQEPCDLGQAPRALALSPTCLTGWGGHARLLLGRSGLAGTLPALTLCTQQARPPEPAPGAKGEGIRVGHREQCGQTQVSSTRSGWPTSSLKDRERKVQRGQLAHSAAQDWSLRGRREEKPRAGGRREGLDRRGKMRVHGTILSPQTVH